MAQELKIPQGASYGKPASQGEAQLPKGAAYGTPPRITSPSDMPGGLAGAARPSLPEDLRPPKAAKDEGGLESFAHAVGMPLGAQESQDMGLALLHKAADPQNLTNPARMMLPSQEEVNAGVASSLTKAGQEAKTSYQQAKRGNLKEAAASALAVPAHIAAAVATPLGGQNLEKAGEQFGAENYKGGLGTTLGTIAPVVVGGAIAGRKPSLATKESAFNALHPENAVSDNPSILPEMRNAAAEIAANKPANPILSKLGAQPKLSVPKGKAGVRVAEDVAQKAIDQHNEKIRPVVEQNVNEPLDNTSAGDAARKTITSEMRSAAANGNTGAGDQIAAIEEIAKRAENAQSIGTADQLRHSWNDELHGDYAKSEAAQSVAPAVTQAKRAALNQLRGNFYNRLGELTGQDLSPLAKREGLLLEAKTGVRATGDRALKSVANDQGNYPRVQAVKKTASKISLTRPGTWAGIPDVIRAAIDPESVTPTGKYISRTKRAFSDLSAPTEVQPPAFPGGKLPVQAPLPTVSGPLFDITQTPHTPPGSAPAIPFGADDLLQPGRGEAPSQLSTHQPGQPVSQSVATDQRPEINAAGLEVGRGDEGRAYGRNDYQLVGETHPEIASQVPEAVMNAAGMKQPAPKGLPPQSSIQLGPSSLGVSGGSQAADVLPPQVSQAVERRSMSRDLAGMQPEVKQRATQVQADGLLKRAGLQLENYNPELDTVTFSDPQQPNRMAVMKVDDLLQGGPDAAQAKMAERTAAPEAKAQKKNEVLPPEVEGAVDVQKTLGAKPKGFVSKAPKSRSGEAGAVRLDLPSIIGDLIDKGGELLEKAPTFFSKAAQAVQEKLPNNMSGAQALSTLKNSGISSEQMKWLDLDNFLSGKKTITKDELLNYIRDNDVQVEEKSLGGISPTQQKWMDTMRNKLSEGYKMNPEEEKTFNELNNTESAQYPEYQLNGEKANPRELLLSLPPKENPALEAKIAELQKQQDTLNRQYRATDYYDRDRRRELGNQMEEVDQQLQDLNDEKKKGQYVKGHYGTRDPNIFAHVRFNDRTLPDGRKILFIEELQSDLHQTGRREGYKVNPISQGELQKKRDEYLRADNMFSQYRGRKNIYDRESLQNQPPDVRNTYLRLENERNRLQIEHNEMHQNANRGVPDLPFKNNWQEVAMKRMIRYAAENGYDTIGWTTGQQQAERWGTERFDWQKEGPQDQGNSFGNKYKVSSTNQSGGEVAGIQLEEEARRRNLLKERVNTVSSPEELHPMVSSALQHSEEAPRVAERLWKRMQASPEGTMQPRKEGMEGFYDNMLTDFLNKYTKKWGGKVVDSELEVPPNIKHNVREFSADELNNLADELESEPQGWNDEETGEWMENDQAVDPDIVRDIRDMVRDMENGSSWQEAYNDQSTMSTRRWFEQNHPLKKESIPRQKIHTIEITPQMKHDVLYKGQPISRRLPPGDVLPREVAEAIG